MNFIPEYQIATYLRLKKELSQFRSTGHYFESTTFDWFYLHGSPDDAHVQLVRSCDEGDEWHCDVTSFSTINEEDEDEELRHHGSLEDCLTWVEENGGRRDRFVGPGMIDKLYRINKTEQDHTP